MEAEIQTVGDLLNILTDLPDDTPLGVGYEGTWGPVIGAALWDGDNLPNWRANDDEPRFMIWTW